MASLSDQDLLFVVESERAMERYLRENCQNPRNMDSRIWKIHFRATKKKRMGVLNSYFDALLARSKIQYNYLPHEMLVANLYKELKIPFRWNVRCDVVKLDITKNKYCSLDKFQKRYNHFPRSYAAVYAKLGPYAFDENTLQPIVKYSEFKKRQEDKSCLSPSYQSDDPVATSTPKRKSMSRRSGSVQPFSDIANLFSSKDRGKTTSQKHAKTNLPRTSRLSAVSKTKNDQSTRIPVSRNRKTKESARKATQVNETGESSVFAVTDANEHRPAETRESMPKRRTETSASKSSIRASKRVTVRRSITEEPEKYEPLVGANKRAHPSEINDDRSKDTRENFPVEECIENIERELESTSSSTNGKRCTRSRHNIARRSSLNTCRSNPSNVPDPLRILEEASDESGSISTSERSTRRGTTSVLDAFRPPLPVRITRRRQSAAAIEIIEDDAANKDDATELLQHVPSDTELIGKDVEESTDRLYENLTSAEESLQSTPAPVTEQTVPVSPPEGLVDGCVENLQKIETTFDIDEIIRGLVIETAAAPIKSVEEMPSSTGEEDPSAVEDEKSRGRTVDGSTTEANKEDSVVFRRKSSVVGSSSGRISRADGQSTSKIGSGRQSLMVDFMPKVKTTSSVLPESLDGGSVPKRILRSNLKEIEVVSLRTPGPEFPTRRITRSLASSFVGGRSPSPILGRKSFVDDSSPPMNSKSDRSASLKSSSVYDRSSSPILGRKSFVGNSSPPAGSDTNSSQTSRKSVTRNARNKGNPLSPTNISSQLNTINEEDEDSVFREPTSQNVGQSRSQRRTRATKPKAQNEKKQRSIIERVDHGVTKITGAKTEEDDDVFVESPEPVVSQSSAYHTVRKLFTDDAVLKATKRRTRKSKNACSDSESYLSDHSSLADRSYAGSLGTPGQLFDSIASQMDSISLRAANPSAADAKMKASKKTSTSTSPSLFNVGSERSSDEAKKKSLSSRSSGSYLASQVSISFHADDERSVSNSGSQASRTSRVRRKSPPASDESSDELQIQRTTRQSKTRMLQSSSSSSGSAKSTRSCANESHRVDASPKEAAEEDDSKRGTGSCSPRSDEFAKAAVEKYFLSMNTSLSPGSSSSKSLESLTNASPSPRNYSTSKERQLFLDDEMLPDATILDRKIEQYLADTRNYGSMMEIDDNPSGLRSPPNYGAEDGLGFVHYSPKTPHSLSKSLASTNWDGNSSTSPASINFEKRRDLRSEDDDSLELLRNVDKFTSPTENDEGTANLIPSPRTTFDEFLQSLNSRLETSPKLCLQTSKSSPTSTTRSKKPTPSTSATMRALNSNSPVFDSPTNVKAGKRRFVEEGSDCTPEVSSSSVKQQVRPSQSGSQSAREITKKRKKRSVPAWKRSPSDCNSSSEDDEKLSQRGPTGSIPEKIGATLSPRKNSEKAISVVTIDGYATTSGIKSRASKKWDGSYSLADDVYKRFHFSTDEEDYSSDELTVLIESSFKKREQLRKTSQEKIIAKPVVEKDFTTEVLKLLDRAESRRREAMSGSLSELKSSSLDPSSCGSSLDALRDAQWNAMPSSAESASTTAEEKLQKIRESCWKESYEHYTNSLNLSQCLESQPKQKNTNYMSDDDFV